MTRLILNPNRKISPRPVARMESKTAPVAPLIELPGTRAVTAIALQSSKGRTLVRRTLRVLAMSVMAVIVGARADAAVDDHVVPDQLAAEAAALAPAFVPPPAAPVNPAECIGIGAWGPVIPWTPHIPVTGAQLPDGRLLTFASNQRTTFPIAQEFTYAAVWDPATGAFTELNNTRHDMFCGGVSLLPDGRVLVNGGRNTVTLSSIFDPRTGQWSAASSMHDPRWYNTSVALSDGSVFTAAGTGAPDTAERWTATGGWTRYTAVDWGLISNMGGFESIWHPFLTVAPNGKLFHFGPTLNMNWMDTSGSGALTPAGLTVPGTFYPKDSSWAVYDEGKILVAAGVMGHGDERGSNLSYTVDISGAVPVAAPAQPMQTPRRFSNAVILPSGEVMAIGGNTSGEKFSDNGSVLTPEIWNPSTGQWRNAANMSVPRNYHSLAFLLPDGRVWSGGGGLAGNAADHRDAQLFTPPCLFNADGTLAARPVISQAPASISHGMQFTVNATPGLAKFAFIKLSSATHSMNTDLRHISLPFTESSAGVYSLAAHANRHVMTPGFWMLFAVQPSGVYSVSKIIQVTISAGLTLDNPGNQSTSFGESVSLQLTTSNLGGATPSFAATGLPAGLAINSATGLISGTMNAAAGSVASVTVSVAAGGQTRSQSFTWASAPARGLVGAYFNGAGFQTQVLERRDLWVDFDWGNGAPGPGLGADQFSVRWTGAVEPEYTETYSFHVVADDGVRLWINGALLFDSWINTAPMERTGSIALTAGVPAEIKLEYYESSGGAMVRLLWSSARTAKAVIPSAALRPFANRAPVLVNPGSQSSQRSSAASLQLSAFDPDGDTLAFSATGLPDGLSINPGTGLISGTVASFASASSNVTVTVSDGRLAVPQTFTWSTFDPLQLSPISGLPKPAGMAINLTAQASGGANARFKWSFGDGTPETAWSLSPSITKTFSAPGRYLVTVTATDDTGELRTASYRQAVHAPLTASRPRNSSSIAFEDRATGNDRLWIVNGDNRSVGVFDVVTGAKLAEVQVQDAPRCVAVAPDGRVWVTNADSATISVIDPVTFAIPLTIALPRGSRPYGVIFDPAGANAYVALESGGKVLRLNPSTGAQTGSVSAGDHVRHLSITADGTRVLASRFITPPVTGEGTATINTSGQGGQVLAINAGTLAIASTIILAHSEVPDTSTGARGIPNYLGAAAITPDGLSAWVPSKQDNIKRGVLRSGTQLTHDMTVRAIASRIALSTASEDLASRVDFDNAGMPAAIAFDPWGSYAFCALEASRAVAVFDVWSRREILRIPVGRAPQAVILSPDGGTLYVHNFMDRTVSVHDVTPILNGAQTVPGVAAVLDSVTTEQLSPQVLRGKQLFYDAKDNRLALQEYMSCAVCHNDGGHDGRVWDLTGVGEGLRNTVTLHGHAGRAPLHWTGNFDEVQDFENQIRGLAGGTGLIENGTPNPPAGAPNAGRSADLDALAAYVASLATHGNSPHRAANGQFTAAAIEGEKIFRTQNCASCHGGANFTISAPGVFRDVGTIKPSTGQRLGGPLPGLNVPTLRGVWATAPYLHDGSAATLADAVRAHAAYASLSSADVSNLAAYLQQIDDAPVLAPVPFTITFATASASVTGAFDVTVTFSHTPSGYAQSDITVTNGAISNFSAASFRVTPSLNGAVTVKIAANSVTDSSGLGNAESNTLIVSASGIVQQNTLVGADIGAVGAAGSTTLAGGVYSLRGAGADIYDTADSFHFACLSLAGDGEISARITGLSNTSDWAKAGVMIRESAAANSRNALLYLAPYESGNGAEMMWRQATGGSTAYFNARPANPPPNNWVRLVRSGSSVTGYLSADGATWTQLETVTFSNLPSSMLVGLVVCSTNPGALATATFDNVRIVGPQGVVLGGSADQAGIVMPELSAAQGAVGALSLSFTRAPYAAGTVELQIIGDLASSPAGWRRASSQPVASPNANGSVTYTFSNIALEFPGAARGFARLHAELDTDGDSFADAQQNGEVFGFTRRAFETGVASFANAFASPPAARAVITAAGAGAVTLNGTIPALGAREHYLEIVRGMNEGQRYEINEAASTASTLAIEPGAARGTLGSLPPSLVGDTAVIRAHHTVSSLLPASSFTGGAQPASADRVQFFNGTTFETLWALRRSDGTQQWVRQGDATLADAGSRVVDVTEGLMLQIRGPAVTVTASGQVRSHAVAMPLKAGTQLRANPWPSDMSPFAMGMTSARGWVGASNAASADRIQLWRGDADFTSSGYATLFLLNTGALNQWTAQGDATLADHSQTPLMPLMRGVFLKSIAAKPGFFAPCPYQF